MKWFFDRIRRLSLHSSWSDQKIRCRKYSDGNGLLLQRTVGNFNTKTTPHGKSRRNRTLQKVSWNSLKIHSFDFWNGRPYVWKCNFFRTQRKHWMKITTHFWMALEMKTILWIRTHCKLVCEPNVVQLQAHRLGILLYKFREEFDLHGMSMGPNPEGFGSYLSHNISPNGTKFFTHVLTYVR